MPPLAETLTTTEAAVVSRVSPREVNRVIDEHILPREFLDPSASRKVATAGCALISFYYGSATRLTADERLLTMGQVSPRLRALGLGSKRLRKEDWAVQSEFVTINLAPFVLAARKGLGRLRAARAMVTTSPLILCGVPVITGTRVPVHDVAAIRAEGTSEEALLEAYPSLTPEQIELSSIYADAYPLRGRPRRPRPPEGSTILVDRRVPLRQAG